MKDILLILIGGILIAIAGGIVFQTDTPAVAIFPAVPGFVLGLWGLILNHMRHTRRA
jgi:hypothetical protein